jgi:hypothetical protein
MRCKTRRKSAATPPPMRFSTCRAGRSGTRRRCVMSCAPPSCSSWRTWRPCWCFARRGSRTRGRHSAGVARHYGPTGAAGTRPSPRTITTGVAGGSRRDWLPAPVTATGILGPRRQGRSNTDWASSVNLLNARRMKAAHRLSSSLTRNFSLRARTGLRNVALGPRSIASTRILPRSAGVCDSICVTQCSSQRNRWPDIREWSRKQALASDGYLTPSIEQAEHLLVS